MSLVDMSSDSKLDDLSYMCMEYCDCVEYINQTDNVKIDTFEKLIKDLDHAFRVCSSSLIHEYVVSLFFIHVIVDANFVLPVG
jgi:hypothetical protein